MKNVIGSFEDAIEQGAHAVSDTAKKQVTSFVKTASGQVIGNQSSNVSQSDQGTNEVGTAQQKQMSDDQVKKFLQDLYGKSDQGTSEDSTSQNNSVKQDPQNKNNSNPQQNPLAQAIGLVPKNLNEDKSPEEIAKMEALRQQLHKDYYESLTKPQNQQQEESVTEKLEREDEQEKMELWEKDKEKPPPLPATVKQGTGESVVGVSG